MGLDKKLSQLMDCPLSITVLKMLVNLFLTDFSSSLLTGCFLVPYYCNVYTLLYTGNVTSFFLVSLSLHANFLRPLAPSGK